MVGCVQVWNGLKVSNGYSEAMGGPYILIFTADVGITKKNRIYPVICLKIVVGTLLWDDLSRNHPKMRS